MQPLDVLACNSANKQSFQNLTKNPFAQCSLDVKSVVTSMEHWLKRLFVRFLKDGLLAELEARVPRSCRVLLFWHHNYQVSLNNIYLPLSAKLYKHQFFVIFVYKQCRKRSTNMSKNNVYTSLAHNI